LIYVLVQVTANAPLIQVKLLQAINGNPDTYSYLCPCERSLIGCVHEKAHMKQMYWIYTCTTNAL